MKKLRLTALSLIAFMVFSSNACEKEMPEPPVTSTGAGGNGNGNGSYNCNNGYQGPIFDPQADVFCQAAYNYRCNGNNAQAEANCQIYRQLQADNPGIPSCPYCN